MIVVAMMAIVGVLAYGGFLLNPRNRGDFLPWSIVILCEVTLLAHALMAMWTMLSSTRSPRDYAFHSSKRLLYDMDVNERLGVSDDATKWPLHLGGRPVSVDILITVYGESLDTIRATATGALNVRGAHHT